MATVYISTLTCKTPQTSSSWSRECCCRPGSKPLQERFEVREGGLDATREDLLELVPGAAALVADPAVPVDAELLDAAGGRS